MQGTLGIILVAVLAAAMLYRRYRILGSARRIRPLAMSVRIVVMSLMASLMFLLPWASPSLFVGALLAGASLGLYALSRVEFEEGEKGTIFRVKSYVGLVVFAMFAVRLVWRMSERLASGQSPWSRRIADPDGVAPEHAPLTLLLLLVVFGYAVCLNGGILIRRRWMPPARP